MGDRHGTDPEHPRGRRARRYGSIKGLFVMWLICLPIAFLFVQLTRDVPIRSAKAVGAAYDWYGERGTVTVTQVKTVSVPEGKRRQCHGDFRPDGGGTTVVDVRVHISGGCQEGRQAEARLLHKDTSSWLIKHDDHEAYAGTGAAEPIVVGLLMGAFCLIVGGPFVVCAVLFPFLMVVAWRRSRALDST